MQASENGSDVIPCPDSSDKTQYIVPILRSELKYTIDEIHDGRLEENPAW